MFTIRIRTKSTKAFSWNSSAARYFGERIAATLHEAVTEGVTDFQDYASGDGAQEGLQACLVTWEDGNELHAFLVPRDAQIPDNLPWVLIRTKPEHVTRNDTPRGMHE